VQRDGCANPAATLVASIRSCWICGTDLEPLGVHARAEPDLGRCHAGLGCIARKSDKRLSARGEAGFPHVRQPLGVQPHASP
jgi:hypothetical protein